MRCLSLWNGRAHMFDAAHEKISILLRRHLSILTTENSYRGWGKKQFDCTKKSDLWISALCWWNLNDLILQWNWNYCKGTAWQHQRQPHGLIDGGNKVQLYCGIFFFLKVMNKIEILRECTQYENAHLSFKSRATEINGATDMFTVSRTGIKSI